MRTFLLLSVTLVGLPFFNFSFADGIEKRAAVAVRVESPPRIDGELEDSAWRDAHWQGGFVQVFMVKLSHTFPRSLR